MELSGAEILVQSLAEHHIDIVFGYPGSCVMPILDNLFDNKDIRHILVRHEQDAVHAACGYARLSNKPGVVLTTSGPGATNTITGLANALYNEIPLLVLTGQVSSNLLGTDAFQEADMVDIAAPVTKWTCQIRQADQIADTVSKAFRITVSDPPGPVLLDITKDAQAGKAEYCPTISLLLPENAVFAEVIELLGSSGKDIVLILDIIQDESCSVEYVCSPKVISSGYFYVPGFGLPAAIGAKYAAQDKVICLVTGKMEFQSTCKELGVIIQEGLDVKMILIGDSQKDRQDIKHPDFVQLADAYHIEGYKIGREEDLSAAIHKMLHSSGSYLLEII